MVARCPATPEKVYRSPGAPARCGAAQSLSVRLPPAGLPATIGLGAHEDVDVRESV